METTITKFRRNSSNSFGDEIRGTEKTDAQQDFQIIKWLNFIKFGKKVMPLLVTAALYHAFKYTNVTAVRNVVVGATLAPFDTRL